MINYKQIIKISGFSFLFLLLTVSIKAQQSDNNIDLKTYQLFQNKMYKEVILTGEKAIKDGIDYFYLRNRIAISYYELKNYRMAAFHFEKALKFNSDDATTLEYLYYTYSFAGRTSDANYLISQFPEYLKEQIHFKKKFINSIYAEGGPSISNNISENSGLKLDNDSSIYGENDMNDNMMYFHFGVKHDLFSWLSLYHGISSINISKRKKFGFNNKDTSFNYSVNQFEYYINTDIQISEGLKITPAFHLINVNADLTNVVINPINKKVLFTNSSLNLNNFVLSLGISKDYKLFTFSGFCSYSNLNNENQYQLGTSFTYFPFGNLNLYSNTTLNILNLNKKTETLKANANNNNRVNKIIFDQMLGVKLLPKLSAEGFFTIGNIEYYNEKNAFVVYNIADKINFKTGFTLIYTYNSKFELSLRYQNLRRENNYKYYNTDLVATEVSTKYQNNTIIGGIKWKL